MAMIAVKLRQALFTVGFFLSGLIPVAAWAQSEAFSPAFEDSLKLNALFQTYERQYNEDIHALPSRFKKDLEQVYEQRWKNISGRFDQKEIYTDTAAQHYLNRLASEIRKGNPGLLPEGFACYFSRSPVPNAEYIGEGIILFNMGLFERLDNEGEAAFVLCHEMAHYILRHSENSIHQYVETLNSEEVQNTLHKIKGSEYRKNEQLLSLVKGLTFDSRRHSRDHESQADSMAVELMRHTSFALPCAISALSLLDHIDSDTLNMSLYLPSVFNAAEYPFRKKWIAHDEGLLGGHAKISQEEMADSLKTHPDCMKRILLLGALTKSWSQPVAKHFVVDSAVFFSLKNRFRFETIEFAYQAKNYTESLFLTLELLKACPNEPWLVTQVGKLFNGIYRAQKKHELSKITDLPSPGYPANYNLLLQFIQNLYLEEIASINYYYLKPYYTQMNGYKPYQSAFELSKQLLNN